MASEYNASMKGWAARRERIKALYSDGMPLSTIAKRYRITPARAHQIINGKPKRGG